ncbi:apolipoprotein D-like [Cochliomyia hominivorax]
MNKIFVSLTILSTLLVLGSAQVFSEGACPSNLKIVEDFSVDKYLGKWFEYAKYPVYFESNGKCINAQYSLSDKANVVNVKNSLVYENNNMYSDILGTASVVANGKLLVKFTVSPVISVSSNYWILDTDYENYSVVYSCVPVTDELHSTIVWILTREALPEPDIIEKALSVLKDNNISLNELKVTNQISCNDVVKDDRPDEEKPEDDKPEHDKPEDDKPEDKLEDDKHDHDEHDHDKHEHDKHDHDKHEHDKHEDEKPEDEKPEGEEPEDNKPEDEKPEEEEPEEKDE